jgi:hypothetical protein
MISAYVFAFTLCNRTAVGYGMSVVANPPLMGLVKMIGYQVG